MSKEDGVINDVQRLGVRSGNLREVWTELFGRSRSQHLRR
jgi:hypothetical protein